MIEAARPGGDGIPDAGRVSPPLFLGIRGRAMMRDEESQGVEKRKEEP